LKNPRCDELRATKRGVAQKFCSVPHITNALSHQNQVAKMHKDKNVKLQQTVERMLHLNWQKRTYPILAELQNIIVDQQLSEFDASFLNN